MNKKAYGFEVFLIPSLKKSYREVYVTDEDCFGRRSSKIKKMEIKKIVRRKV